MATKREAPARKRRRPVKKTAAKKAANSKISEAQEAATKRRAERDSPRGQAPGAPKNNLQRDPNAPKLEAPSNTPMASSGRGVDQDKVAARDNTAGKSMAAASQKIAGLAAPVMASMQAAAAERAKNSPLANPDLYGGTNKTRATRLATLQNTMNDQKFAKSKSQGQAVWMGPKTGKIRNKGPGRIDPETGSTTTTEVVGDEILTKAELLSWLSDPQKVDQIMAVAQKAGLAVASYEDAQKLWASVVDQAASSYSLAGKEVTPWALIQLRGKYAVNGKPADKITTTTNIDEMSPAQARLMFEQTAQQQLGRAPTKAEVDDFIAKAQTIATSNPTVTKTTQKIGFDGNVTDTTNVTTGGGAQAESQLAAMDAAKQTEDYGAYQAAGNYFPMLFEAIQSPV